MDSGFTFRPIARAHNAYTDKFAVPRQSGLVPEVLTGIRPRGSPARPGGLQSSLADLGL